MEIVNIYKIYKIVLKNNLNKLYYIKKIIIIGEEILKIIIDIIPKD